MWYYCLFRSQYTTFIERKPTRKSCIIFPPPALEAPASEDSMYSNLFQCDDISAVWSGYTKVTASSKIMIPVIQSIFVHINRERLLRWMHVKGKPVFAHTNIRSEIRWECLQQWGLIWYVSGNVNTFLESFLFYTLMFFVIALLTLM